MTRLPKSVQLLVAGLLISMALLIAFILLQEKRMKTTWTAPFYSAARNLTIGGPFLINKEEVVLFNELDDRKAEDNYRFIVTHSLSAYNHNPMGYVYLVASAAHLFPFLGHQKAVILFQCLFYILVCLLILNELHLPSRRFLFLTIFALNPLLLRFVVFNFYYFWQLIPALLIYGLHQRFQFKTLWILLLVLPFVFLARPTTLTWIPLLVYVLYRHPQFSFKKGIVVFAYSLSVFFFCFHPSQKNIWHTIYVGFGAYPNPYGIKLDDSDAYRLYEQKHTMKFTFDAYGNYYNPEIIESYKQTTKEAVLVIAQDNPILLIRNATLNFFESFSLGYLNQWPLWCNYVSALLGLVVCILLMKQKYYVYFVGITLGSMAYILYYPPIPAYMYGNYVFIVGAFIEMMDKTLPKKLFSRSAS